MTTLNNADSLTYAPFRRVIRGSLHLVREGRRLAVRDAPAVVQPSKPVAHPKARLLAVGYRLRAAIESGEFENQAQLADALGFSRARVTQLIGLTFEPPWVQEEWLVGVEGPVSEQSLDQATMLGVTRSERRRNG